MSQYAPHSYTAKEREYLKRLMYRKGVLDIRRASTQLGDPQEITKELHALEWAIEKLQSLCGPSHDLAERCKEVLAWKAVGVLKGEALRKLAATKQPEDYALRLAEAQTADEAMQFVIDSCGATPQATEDK